MGFISEYRRKAVPLGTQTVAFRPTREVADPTRYDNPLRRRRLGTDKDEALRGDVPWGGYQQTSGRSAAAEHGVKRLLEALRSKAPGGWSDDRWEATLRHYYGVTFIAVTRIGIRLSQSEFQVYHRDPDEPTGRRPVCERDPPQGDHRSALGIRPYDLVKLLQRPNSQDSWGKLMFRWAQQRFLTGMALTWMVPNLSGVPMELYCLPTAGCLPQPAVNPTYPDGYWQVMPYYPYGPFSSYPRPSSAVGARIPSQWMLRMIGIPHPLLRYEGYAYLTGMRQHLDEIEMMDRSRTASMRRGINPSAVLDMSQFEGAEPWIAEELERMKAEYEASLQGPENAGQLFCPPPGAKLETFGARPVDMDYQNGWDQLVSFCLGGFGINKPAAGMVEASAYSTLFASIKQLNLTTLDPECADIGSELTNHLAPFFGDDLIVEVKCGRIDDHDVENSKLDRLIAAKAMTKNMLLIALGYPPTKEKWGDEIVGQETMPGQPGGADALQAVLGGALGQGQGQPSAAPPGAAKPGSPDAAGFAGAEPADQVRDEPGQVFRSRPTTGALGRGALGVPPTVSRRSLPGSRVSTKSFYDQVMEVIGNGHH